MLCSVSACPHPACHFLARLSVSRAPIVHAAVSCPTIHAAASCVPGAYTLLAPARALPLCGGCFAIGGATRLCASRSLVRIRRVIRARTGSSGRVHGHWRAPEVTCPPLHRAGRFLLAACRSGWVGGSSFGARSASRAPVSRSDDPAVCPAPELYCCARARGRCVGRRGDARGARVMRERWRQSMDSDGRRAGEIGR